MVAPTGIVVKNVAGFSGSRYWFGAYPCGTTNNIPTGVVARCLKEVWGRPTKGRPRLFLSGCRLRRFKGGGARVRRSVGERKKYRKNVKKGLQFLRPGAILD